MGSEMCIRDSMHSPLFGDKMFLPWNLGDTTMFQPNEKMLVIQLAIAYVVMAGILFALGKFGDYKPINSDQEFEKAADVDFSAEHGDHS